MGGAAVAHADGIPSRGGACCADLEERVAELEATTARKGNRRVSLTISGQVTTALMAWDDGDRSDVYIVDPPTAGGTLFTFAGSAKVNPSLTAGFNITIGLDRGARSHQVTADDDDGAGPGDAGKGDTTMVMTLANWYLDHKSLGRVTVGRINTATAGVSGVNLGGTSVIANVNLGYWNRSFDAQGTASTWTNLLGGNTMNGSTLSRANAISYSSPTVGGFSVSAAWGENDLWDAALRYAGEFGGFRLAAAVGYGQNIGGLGEAFDDNDDAGDGTGITKASASLLHVGTGLYLTGAYVHQDDNGHDNQHDGTLYYLQGGITKNWTGLGNTAFYAEYANVDTDKTVDVAGDGFPRFTYNANTDVWGLGVVQHIDAAAMELFLSYRNYSGGTHIVNGGDVDAEDMDIVMGGARIRF
ncbi:MAG TPA: porin [Hyphomicrobiaceae bacterium]|nr:porin [Hyphomicrobiaceae bacterium]